MCAHLDDEDSEDEMPKSDNNNHKRARRYNPDEVIEIFRQASSKGVVAQNDVEN